MDATSVLLHLSQSSSPHHQPLHFNHFGDRVADRTTLAARSFIRSSAPRQMPHYTSQFHPSSFRSTYSMASSSSGSSSFVPESSRLDSSYDFLDAKLRTLGAPQSYHAAEQYPSAPSSWAQQVDQPQVAQYATNSYSSSSYGLADGSGMSPPIKSEDAPHIESYEGYYLSQLADHIQNTNAMLSEQHASLATSYDIPSAAHYQPDSTAQPQLHYPYGSHDAHTQPSAGQDVANMSSYMLSNEPPLQYPDYSDNDMPRFVHPAQVSPDISPASPYAQLHDVGPQGQSCDPRFTTMSAMQASGPSGSSPSHFTDFDLDSGSASGGDSPSLVFSVPIPVPAANSQRKRQRSVSFTSSSEEEYQGSSGESERDDDGDDEYIQSPRASRRHGELPSDMSPSMSPSSGSLGGSGRRLAPPVPVPNLTKKSRGRRVPTAQQVVNDGNVQKRMYMCKVPGCGKCFARGEHLKRHVRSIHTNEKPHKCPYPGCGKEFSRHDNLGQHMRVHKGFQMPKSGRL
ncbi:hypothetical protein BD311DRAFT_414960 [Dichomitus squalens]|uniref:C2H2-type domain-containing protein n=1 Tax=Dichomitus squalens TaxID=114155 RepID=A0A4Q9MKM2_9APHY|nr:hypothetical protein BD311DRAFT_414960 [Dichomitus squalens]